MRLTDGYESSIKVLWRASDLVECLIFVGLALMLAYTAVVKVRFFRRYFAARCEAFSSYAGSATASERGKKNLVADLSRGVGTLQSISRAAPFLGLAGTCYGILCLFARGYVWGLHYSIPLEISAAFLSTAAGLIVAIPAAISYNIVLTRLEKFENSGSSTLLEATPRSYRFAQTLPLRRRFEGMPAFALIGVPVLAIPLLLAFLMGPRTSTGLPVRLLKIRVSAQDSSPIIVSVIATNGGVGPILYVNSKETSWDELGNTLRSQLKVRPNWVVYVEGKDYAAWRDVVNVIDVARGLHAEVVLLTAAPNVGSDNGRNKRLKGKVRRK